MKRVLEIFLSIKFSLVLLGIFAISLGTATFIEEKYDTVTAGILVYNAHWFEALLLLMALNFIGNINKFKMLSAKKFPGLIFHLAFVLLILGAGITRYIGYEGTMHIRDGQAVNFIYSSDTYLQVIAGKDNKAVIFDKKLILSDVIRNDFHYSIGTDGNGPIDIRFKNYIKNAVEKVVENVPGGTSILELVYVIDNEQHSLLLKNGETAKMGDLLIGFNNTADTNSIQILPKDGKLSLVSPVGLFRMQMSGVISDTILRRTAADINASSYFNLRGVSFGVRKQYVNAKTQWEPGNKDDKGVAALVLDVSYGGKQEEITIPGGSGYASDFVETNISEMNIKIAYGERKIELPFSLRLDRFVLDRYAGSMSPSSFTSEVTLIDTKNNINEKRRIFMNNVLDYQGFRFFQSSYDTDEKGTILSVNHDFAGTWVTYTGYFFLAVGFFLTLFNKNSRFRSLSGLVREARAKRKSLVTAIIILLAGSCNALFSQNAAQPYVSSSHAEKFGQLLVQTYDGRFEPLQTLAYDVMHKISRKDHFDIAGKGEMTSMQVLIDMLMDGEFWKNQKIIYIREKSVADALGIQGKYASIMDFFDPQSKYRLSQFTETSFRKKQSEQNAFDKEIIKLDERVNIYITLLNGTLLKIFPLIGSPTHRWLSPNDTLAFAPLTGAIGAMGNELQLKEMNYSNLLRLYFQKAGESVKSGDYSAPDKITGIIEAIQRQNTPEDLLPSVRMVKLEEFYNNAQIFIQLRNWYAMLSLILLSLAFVDIIRAKKSKIIGLSFSFFAVLLGIAFLYHTYGMGLRWYLSGHAPWSNGYEALLLMAWGSLLAGFSFIRYSKITLAATVLLAASMLMTASHSSYDPQLTNLQPVLKSYWLIIHVAVITISYGFLGLGFVLGLINMFITLFKSSKNNLKLSLITQELTYINEMNLTIGLFLATLGTFLGGVWANESWGRYWGWDAKETWALVIVIAYSIILHFRLIPKLKSAYAFNVGSIFGFGSVLMTFIGVNYYLSKGMHSYAADDTPVFPVWAWVVILAVIALIVVAGIKENNLKRKLKPAEMEQAV